jgi:hypothetical protein
LRYDVTRTRHSQPWALIHRNGDTSGKRISTRMAYLVDTIAPNGTAVALTGYIMRGDMVGWTKHPRRIEWFDIIRQWSRQLTIADVHKVKSRLPVTSIAENGAVSGLASMPSSRCSTARDCSERERTDG